MKKTISEQLEDALGALAYIEAYCRARANCANNPTADADDLRELVRVAREPVAEAEGNA